MQSAGTQIAEGSPAETITQSTMVIMHRLAGQVQIRVKKKKHCKRSKRIHKPTDGVSYWVKSIIGYAGSR